MKAFSFSSILKNFGKQLSSLASQMPWCNLRFNLGSISVLSRVNPLFSRTSFGVSFGTSRRASHFAAILTILFTIGVGNVSAQETVTWTPTSTHVTNLTQDNKSLTIGTGKNTFTIYAIRDGNTPSISWSNSAFKFGDAAFYKSGISVYIPEEANNIESIKFYLRNTNSKIIYYKQLTKQTTASNPDGLVELELTTSYTAYTPFSTPSKGVYYAIGGKASSSGGDTYLQKIEVVFASSCNSSITPTLTYDNSNLILGQTITANPTLNKDGSSGDVTYSSSNTDVATVDENTGVVTAVGAGEATITATIAANGDYCSGEATATITVNAASGGGSNTATYVPLGVKTITATEVVYCTDITKAGDPKTDWVVVPNYGTENKTYTQITSATDNGNPQGITDNLPNSAAVNMVQIKTDGNTYEGEKRVIHMHVKGVETVVAHGLTTSSGRGLSIAVAEFHSNLQDFPSDITTGTRKSNSGSILLSKTGLDASKEYIISIYASGGETRFYAVELLPPTVSWKLKGSFDDWGDGYAMTGGETVSVTRTLEANYRYEFKFHNGNEYYGNNGAIVTNISNWDFNTEGNNCVLYTGPAGEYIFTFNTTTKKATITYPEVEHPNANYVYFAKPNDWDAVRLYNYTSDSYRMSDWDGSPTITTKTTICGNEYYYCAANTMFEHIIWRDNNSHQSQELGTSNGLGKYFDFSVNTTNWSEFSTYSITFNGNGNTDGSMTNVTGITCGENRTLAENGFTRTGYTFAGWATSANGEKVYNDQATISNITSDITLYAKWTAETYNINYYEAVGEVNDISGLKSIDGAPTSYTILDAVALPALPDKDGYTATGWYSQWCVFENTENTQYWAGCEPTTSHPAGYYGHANYIVKYTPNSYTITWDANGGNVTPESSTYTYDGSAVELPTPTRDGYTFNGWFTAETEGTKITEIGTTNKPTSNVTYYAQWTAETYTVTFNANGGSEVSPITQASAGAEITLPTPTRDGYMFTGWYTATSGGTKIGDAGDSYTPTANITIYAQWENVLVFNLPNDFNAQIQEWAVSSDNSANKLQNYAYVLVEVPEATSEGEVLWKGKGADDNRILYMYTDGALDGNKSFKYSEDYVSQTFGSTNIITIGGKYYLKFSTTADWKAANVKIDLGGAIQTYTLTNVVNTDGYGTVSPASVSEIPSETATSSSSNTYTVNGTTVTATPTANTAQYTYAFDSWSGLPATVTEDATVTANFTRTVNTYTITWKNADGTTLETDENVEYGTIPEYNGETPTKAADAENTYTFEGWSPAISAVTGDATYTATFTATPIVTPGDLYTVTFDTNGGSEVSPITQASAGAEINLPTPTKDGYEFVGWYIGGELVTADTYIPTADITATAAWKENCILGTGGEDNTTHSTTFVGSNSVTGNWSGTNLGSTKFADQTNCLKLKTNGTLTYTFPDVVTLKSVQLKMAFANDEADLPWSLTVKDASDTQLIKKDVITNMIASKVPENFDISLEYNNVKKVTLTNDSEKDLLVGSITFTIVISSGSGECYYVTYNGNGADGGYVNDANAYAANEEVTTLANGFTRAGYTFTGWNTAADGSDASYAAGGTFTITGNTELFAQWKENTDVELGDCTETTITYNLVTHNNTTPSQSATPEGVITELTGADAIGTATTNTGVINNSFADYSVRYGASEGSDNTNDGVTFTFTVPTGYVFKPSDINTNLMCYGWGQDENNGTQLYKFYGTLSDGATTINGTADPGKKNGANADIAYSDIADKTLSGTVTLRLNAVRVAGEQSKPSFRIKSPITIEGKLCSAQTYTITYDNNGGSGTMGSTSNVVAENEFTRDGYTFDGWNTKTDGTGKSYAAGEIVASNLTLYAQWKCIKPEFTVSYGKTEYTINDDEVSPITVTVTAGNSGGVTYQWYSSTTNDRNNGNTIGDATSASYTPPTTSVGTTYYWCEIENTCTSVQTAMIAITVRANKNTPSVIWTKPTTEVNYGGGNYSISATVNGEWDGTLTTDMLTAPTGIKIYDIKINGKTITAKFDVTTSFDIVANPTTIPFYLSLPETDAYYSLVSEGDVTYEACTTSVGSGEIILEAAETNGETSYYFAADGIVITSIESAGAKNVSFNKKAKITVDAAHKEATITFTIGTGITITSFKTIGTSNSNTEYDLDGTPVTIGTALTDLNKTSSMVFKLSCTDASGSSNRNTEISSFVLSYTSSGNGKDVSLTWDTGDDLTKQVEKTQSAPNFIYKATPSNNTLGTITYSSSNSECATVNSTTGEVEITATGTETLTTTITATLARSGCYQGATATYTISVTGMSCDISAGTLSASKTDKYDCEGVTLTLSNSAQGATIEWWHNGEAITSKDGITINGNILTTTLEGTYSALVTKEDCSVRSNSVTITNIASASATPLVNEWYVKNGRLTPPIALWKLEGGARIVGVEWIKGEESSTAPYDDPKNVIDVENGIVYLTGTPPQANNTEADIRYTIQLSIMNSCDDSPMVVPSTITIIHQKNTDKHVLAFVVTGKEKGGFTEGIPATQTTSVPLYNTISHNFEVLATNIYATDNEQLLKEYYSQFDIICITDYPNTKKTGVNDKSYTDAMGSLIDIRPILSMEAWVSKYTNWNNKGVTGDPKSPTTRQYSMLLQCKDHEIFAGTSLESETVDGETMYRVTMVDKNQEQYKTLDDTYGDQTPHAEKATTKDKDGKETITGYGYGSNPALQGFTYTSAMSSMLPIGIIDDGAGEGNNLQVGLERQHEIEARMMVIGVNSYAMERLTADGQTVIINALNYLMKKNAEDISDCSIYFDNRTGDKLWSNPVNWGPSRNSLPQSSQEARILAPCVVSDYTAKVASVKIVTGGTYKYQSMNGEATGSLTIAPNGALVVKGRIQAATAPNYLEARNTDVKDLIVQSDATGNGALIFNNAAGDTKATVAMYSKAYTNIVDGKKKKHWQYCAIPIHEAPIPEFFWGAYTYLWEEPNGAWTRKRDGATLYEWQPIGVSYGAVMDEQPTYRFYGELTSTDEQSFDLTYTDGTYGGMNLIGNSWTAPINIAAFEDADFEGNITKEILIHNTGRREEVGSDYDYSTVPNTSETPGQWIAIPIGAPKVPEYDGVKVISSLQAFQINVTAASTLTLNYDRLVRSTKQEDLTTPMRAPSRKAQVATIVPKEVRMLKVRVADKKNHADIYIFNHDGFTPQYDNGWDARFGGIVDNYPSLSVLTQDGEMSMAAIPTIDGTTLGFSSGTDNEYMISFKYTGEETLYLNDMQLKKSTQINNVNQYYFTTDVNDMYNRFVISKESFDSPNISTGLANIVTDGNGLQVTNPNQENLQVILIDAAGRMCSIYNTAEPMFKVELPATQGVYMINVKGETTNIVRKVVK